MLNADDRIRPLTLAPCPPRNRGGAPARGRALAAVRVGAQVAGPAALEGFVYDSSGAVLPGVEMGLVNEQGIKWSTPTDGTGRFEFAPVGAGKYVLEAVVPGFRSFKQDIVLEREKDWKKVNHAGGRLAPGNDHGDGAAAADADGGPGPGDLHRGASVSAATSRCRPEVFNVNPVYPPSMQAAGIEGVVKLDALIGADGNVVSVKLANAQVHPDFAASAA
jgi:hypothetical protein